VKEWAQALAGYFRSNAELPAVQIPRIAELLGGAWNTPTGRVTCGCLSGAAPPLVGHQGISHRRWTSFQPSVRLTEASDRKVFVALSHGPGDGSSQSPVLGENLVHCLWTKMSAIEKYVQTLGLNYRRRQTLPPGSIDATEVVIPNHQMRGMPQVRLR
jgi:hypothetical protein